jgi:hypothetical protein
MALSALVDLNKFILIVLLSLVVDLRQMKSERGEENSQRGLCYLPRIQIFHFFVGRALENQSPQVKPKMSGIA